MQYTLSEYKGNRNANFEANYRNVELKLLRELSELMTVLDASTLTPQKGALLDRFSHPSRF